MGDIIKIDIPACDTKGREIISFDYEYLHLYPKYFITAGKMTTIEWEVDEENDNDIDDYIKAASSKKEKVRDWRMKIKKEAVYGIEIFHDATDLTWGVAMFLSSSDSETFSFYNKEDAEKLYTQIDNWLYND